MRADLLMPGALLVAALALASAPATGQERTTSQSDPWAASAFYTGSDFGSNRDDWQRLDVDLYYRATPRWVLTGGADLHRRNDVTDVIYNIGAEHYVGAWRLHASAAVTPDADFSYERGYAIGAELRASKRLSLMLEARGYDFARGDLREIRPGATLWLNDDATAITARYTHGDAFDGTRYNAWSLRLDQDLQQGHRLSLVYANGTDPERDPTVPGVLLSEADFYAAYYRFPLHAGSGPELVLGAEYEERPGAWTRKGLSIGIVARF